jgi:enoyl-CoA hydratase/carnithine racemase
MSQVYEECGCELGDYRLYPGNPIPGCPIVAPPASHRRSGLPGLTRVRSFGLTGWCLDPRKAARMQVDHVLPMSDHADYDELLELIERVEPKQIFCTHGPHKFAKQLRDLGHNACELEDHRPTK